MWTQAAQYLRSRSVGSRVVIWITAFLSPTGFVLAVITLATLQVPAPPAWFIVAWSGLIPLAALLVCSTVVWLAPARRAWRVGWLVSTVLAMLLQVGVLLLIIASAITVAISLP